jgi:CubicO group peptidase (beta-lactamase class C family)
MAVATLGFTEAAIAQDSVQSRIDQYMNALVALNRFSGGFLVARSGQVVREGAFGPANAEWNIPNTTDTKFRIGSITKQFTAMAILILAERGKLHLSDPICQHIAECPAQWRAITIQQLLTHTSGIPDYVGSPSFARTQMQPTSPRALMARFRDLPLRFPPGTHFEYSNSGYVLLGLIIERVSGESYALFLQHEILDPLQLRNTGYDRQETVLTHRAAGYEMRHDSLLNASPIDPSVAYAAGAMYSTVEDLMKWDEALYANRLVSPRALEDMFTPRLDVVGYGWAIGTQFNRRIAHHNGEISGFTSNIARFPDQHVLIVVLGNREGIQVDKITTDLAAIVFGEPYEMPARRTLVTLDTAALDRYAGRYRIAPGIVLTIRRDGEHLVGKLSGSEATQFDLLSVSTTHFVSDSPPVDLVFAVDPQQRVTQVTVNGSFTGTPIARASP